MNTDSRTEACHVKSCAGPVPSHKQDTVLVVDFLAKTAVPQYVEDICGKETVLDTSFTPLLQSSSVTSPASFPHCKDEEISGFSSFSSHRSDDTGDSDEVDSSRKKLMSSPDESYIDICSDRKKGSNSHNDVECSCEAKSVLRAVTYPINATKQFISDYKKAIRLVCLVILALGLTSYMVVALLRNFHRALPLFVIWCLVVIFNVFALVRDHLGKRLMHCMKPLHKSFERNVIWTKWIFVCCVAIGLAVWIAMDTVKRPNQLISGVGYFVFIFGLFVTSKYPDRVIWRPVLWGLLIQFCFGMIILRTEAGFNAFNWLGDLTRIFINYVDAGVKFVFQDYADHYFAFKVLPIVIYFSSFISVMYYLGAMQWLILKIAWLMQMTLNTSATESMVAAGNIFVGQTESPLLIRPYIDDLTISELHAVMTAGFGTIAGSVLGAYLGFGIQPVYVITACVMAAPCALAISKLVYPETKKSKFATYEGLTLDKTDQRNVIEAAFVGASQAIPLVLNIGGNLIAFLSLLAAINGFLGWFGSLLDFEELSFQVICSYVFMPITYLMGIEWRDCFKAAELLGTKIFLNEFIAYESLSDMIKSRDNGTIPRIDPATGMTNWIDERSEAIITYALCGFANVGSLGIMLGGLGAMAPKRQSEMAKIVISGLISGIFVSILNACVAGFLYVPRPIVCDQMLHAGNWSITEPQRLLECCSREISSESRNMTIIRNCCNFTWSTTTAPWWNCSSMTL